MRQRILVFMPGTSFRNASYRLADAPREHEPVTSWISPVALIKLQKRLGLAEYPDKVLALTTDALKNKKAEIEQQFVIDDYQIPVQCIDIPNGQNSAELREMIEYLLKAIPDNCDLVIDITHGFRGGPLVFSLAVQYLSLVNPSVVVKDMYYGMLKRTDEDPDAVSLIVNMAPYLDMLDWIYAMRVFRDTFVPTQLLAKIRSSATSADASDDSFTRLVERLELFSAATDAALPVEMAHTAVDLRNVLAEGLPPQLTQDIPLGGKLFNALKDVASEFIPPGGQVPDRLDDMELSRQAAVVDKLIEHGRIVQAVGLMNEWCTLKVLRHNSNHLGQWRNRGEQEAAATFRKDGRWPDDQLRNDVRRIASVRNILHHYAQQENNTLDLQGFHSEAIELWTKIKDAVSTPEKWRIRLDNDSTASPNPLTHRVGAALQRALKEK